MMRRTLIEIQLDELLEERERTFYWLAKETGISLSTLWRLKKRKIGGHQFRDSGTNLPGAQLSTG